MNIILKGREKIWTAELHYECVCMFGHELSFNCLPSPASLFLSGDSTAEKQYEHKGSKKQRTHGSITIIILKINRIVLHLILILL